MYSRPGVRCCRGTGGSCSPACSPPSWRPAAGGSASSTSSPRAGTRTPAASRPGRPRPSSRGSGRSAATSSSSTVGSGTVGDAGVADRVTAALTALPRDVVLSATSYWQSKAPQLVSADRTRAVATLTLAGSNGGEKLDAYREIEGDLAVDGPQLQVAGPV